MKIITKNTEHLLHDNIEINPLTPNDHYKGRTAQLTSRCCILYIYSTNKSTEYFKHAA